MTDDQRMTDQRKPKQMQSRAGCKTLHLLHMVAPYVRGWRMSARGGRGYDWMAKGKAFEMPRFWSLCAVGFLDEFVR
jgi:hypothetical protein